MWIKRLDKHTYIHHKSSTFLWIKSFQSLIEWSIDTHYYQSESSFKSHAPIVDSHLFLLFLRLCSDYQAMSWFGNYWFNLHSRIFIQFNLWFVFSLILDILIQFHRERVLSGWILRKSLVLLINYQNQMLWWLGKCVIKQVRLVV